MSRSLKKGPYIDEKLAAKVAKSRPGGPMIKTWARECVIYPEMVGYSFGVHNGKEHYPVVVTEAMVGHRLGEFSPTKKFRGHGGRLAREEAASAAAKASAQAAAAVASVETAKK